MSRTRRRVGLLTIAGLVVALLGPCLCAPAGVDAATAGHGCCDTEAGLKPALVDCCGGCSFDVLSPAAGLPGVSSVSAVLLPRTGSVASFAQWAAAAPGILRSWPLLAVSPPIVLRV